MTHLSQKKSVPNVLLVMRLSILFLIEVIQVLIMVKMTNSDFRKFLENLPWKVESIRAENMARNKAVQDWIGLRGIWKKPNLKSAVAENRAHYKSVQEGLASTWKKIVKDFVAPHERQPTLKRLWKVAPQTRSTIRQYGTKELTNKVRPTIPVLFTRQAGWTIWKQPLSVEGNPTQSYEMSKNQSPALTESEEQPLSETFNSSAVAPHPPRTSSGNPKQRYGKRKNHSPALSESLQKVVQPLIAPQGSTFISTAVAPHPPQMSSAYELQTTVTTLKDTTHTVHYYLKRKNNVLYAVPMPKKKI